MSMLYEKFTCDTSMSRVARDDVEVAGELGVAVSIVLARFHSASASRLSS